MNGVVESERQEMTSRERLLASLTGQAPDRIPWAPNLYGYYLASLPSTVQAEVFGFTISDYVPTGELACQIEEKVRYAAIDFMCYIGADWLNRLATVWRAHG